MAMVKLRRKRQNKTNFIENCSSGCSTSTNSRSSELAHKADVTLENGRGWRDAAAVQQVTPGICDLFCPSSAHNPPLPAPTPPWICALSCLVKGNPIVLYWNSGLLHLMCYQLSIQYFGFPSLSSQTYKGPVKTPVLVRV